MTRSSNLSLVQRQMYGMQLTIILQHGGTDESGSSEKKEILSNGGGKSGITYCLGFQTRWFQRNKPLEVIRQSTQNTGI